MAEGAPLKELERYARIARNSQMLLVMEPTHTQDIEEAREAIAEDALSYLNEVEDGVESPYFTTFDRQNVGFVDFLAATRVKQAAWDRVGVFDVADSKIRMPDSSHAQTATFAYLAASCMSRLKVPFYLAPGLRVGVNGPRNLSEFMDTIEEVKDVTSKARGRRFREVVEQDDWRVAFAFWESNKRLAGAMRVEDLAA